MERPRQHRQVPLEFGPQADARFSALAKKVFQFSRQKTGENKDGAFLQGAVKAAPIGTVPSTALVYLGVWLAPDPRGQDGNASRAYSGKLTIPQSQI